MLSISDIAIMAQNYEIQKRFYLASVTNMALAKVVLAQQELSPVFCGVVFRAVSI
jgi:hypothetical protein